MEGAKEITVVFWVGTFFMLFFALGLIVLVLSYKNSFSRMKRKEAELLLKTSLESEKNERQRIAADLHDSVSSDLSAIRNYLAVILKSEKDNEKIEIFSDLKNGVETAIENTRQISYKLMPPLLEKFGLVVALEDYFSKLNEKLDIKFTLDCKDENFKINHAVSYELYRVIQEFTTNMLKYGNVKNCYIILNSDTKFFSIKIIDDGMIYNFKDALATSSGTGLKNISSRLKTIDATIEQQKTTDGNHFIITLPLEKI